MGIQYYFVNMAEKRVLSVGKQYWICPGLVDLRGPGSYDGGPLKDVKASELAALPPPDYWADSKFKQFREDLVAWLLVYGPADFASEYEWDEEPWMVGRYEDVHRSRHGDFLPDPGWECFDAQPPPMDGWKAWPPV